MNQNSSTSGVPQNGPRLIGAEQAKLEKSIKNGAYWFFWIVGLSGINTIIVLTGGDWAFLIGLGVTQLAAGFALGLELSSVVPIIVFVIVGGIFGTLGYFAMKRHTWAFMVGMVLYFLDGLLFLLVMDWLSIGFHIFVLICLGFGLRANIKYKKYMAEKSLNYTISSR